MKVINFLYTLLLLIFIFYMGGLIIYGQSVEQAIDQISKIKTFFITSPSSNSNSVNSSLPDDLTFTPSKDVSRNWSGYVATGGTFTGVTGTWTVPTFDDKSNFGAEAAWVGIGGVSSHDLIQAGTQSAVDLDGEVTYETFWEILPDVSQPLDVEVTGGDSVTVSIKKLATGGDWLISLKNNTNGQSTQIKQTYASSFSSAEWVEEAPSDLKGTLPLNNFGTVKFTDASAIKNGQTLSIADVNAKPVTMANTSGVILAIPSSLGNDGASFVVARTNNHPSIEPYTVKRFRAVPFGQDSNRDQSGSSIIIFLIQELSNRLR